MKQWALAWHTRSRELNTQNRERLNELDRVIGNGDHGENLNRGTSLFKIDDAVASASDVLRQISRGLQNNVDSAGGEILAASYGQMADELTGIVDADADAFVTLIDAGLHGAQESGGAIPGEKTMVDAWAPAAVAAHEALAAGLPTADLLEASAEAARLGAEMTVDMVAAKGRAAFLGNASVGHQDPGALTVALLLQAAHEAYLGLA